MGQLKGGLAHDFNNLLTGIAGSLELLQMRVAQGRHGEIDQYVAAAQGESKRAAALTHRLLAFSRQQTLDPKPTDVDRLIVGMEELIRRTIGPAVALEVISAGGLWNTPVDPNQLENALLNWPSMPGTPWRATDVRDGQPMARRARRRAADIPPGQYISICAIACADQAVLRGWAGPADQGSRDGVS